MLQLCVKTDVLESYPLLVDQLGLARFVVRFEVKLVNVSIAREDDWYVDVFDVLEAVVLTIHASLGFRTSGDLVAHRKICDGLWMAMPRPIARISLGILDLGDRHLARL